MYRGIHRLIRYLTRLSLLGMLLLVCSCADSNKLRVISLNVQWFPGQGLEPSEEEVSDHVQAVKSALSGLKPDLLISTEICDGELFRDVVDDATGLDLHVISNYVWDDAKPGDRNQQIGIASDLKAVAGWAEEWKKTKIPDISRGFAFAALNNPKSGKLIMVYGLHLKSNRSRSPEDEIRNFTMRDESIDQLVGHMNQMEKQFEEQGIDGWIVAGDFNTNHDGRFADHVIEKLVDAGFCNTWATVSPRKRYTWKASGKYKATTFDYIMTKGFGELEASVVEMYQSVSDHNAVVLEIELPVAPAE